MVRDRDRRLTERLDIGDQLLDAARAIEKTVLGVDVEMNKWIQGKHLLRFFFFRMLREC